MTSDEPELSVDVELIGDDPMSVRMTVVGELDLAGATCLASAVESLPNGAALTLHLRGVEFIDTSGIRVLVACHRDRVTTIEEPSDPVLRVCELAEVGYLLTHS